MPTTMIATTHGIGLGIMAQTMSKNIKNIDKILARDLGKDYYGRDIKIDLSSSQTKYINYFNDILNILNDKEKWINDKYLYIESSYGFSSIPEINDKIYIPMWEQGSTIPESEKSNVVISVTKKTEEFLNGKNIKSIYLPFPVEVPSNYEKKSKVKTILHNAGSLGGNMRKGTLDAIRIFQKSKLSNDGVSLMIHSWMPKSDEIQKLIDNDSENIIWSDKFYSDYKDIYKECDIMLFPSKLEGHALVIMESMANGIPVICTDYAPINEYVVDDRYRMPINHFICNEMNGSYAIVDVEKSASILRDICMGNIEEVSYNGYHLMRDNFSWEVLKDKWEEVCK